MLGYLVHNAHVVEDLAQQGVQLIDFDDRLSGLEEIDHGTVIITAHGVAPAVKQRAIDKGLTLIDATCSDVYVTHDLIIDLVRKGYEIVYVGKEGHPEPEGAMGEAPGHVHLVTRVEDVDELGLTSSRIAITTQTTLSVWDTQSIIDAVVAKYPMAEEAAVEAAEVCDLVIVVGGERSSNSKRLVEVVETIKGTPAHLVDSVTDVRTSWFEPGMRIGITSGASTPARITREVTEFVEAYKLV